MLGGMPNHKHPWEASLSLKDRGSESLAADLCEHVQRIAMYKDPASPHTGRDLSILVASFRSLKHFSYQKAGKDWALTYAEFVRTMSILGPTL